MPGPEIVFIGGTDTLTLAGDDKVYQPGDVMPASFTTQDRLSLQRAGVRFDMRYPEPEPKPEPKKPAESEKEAPKEDKKA